MKSLRSIFQVFSVDLLSKVMMGVSAILLIRYMPQSEYGIYTVAMAVTTVLAQTLATCFNRVYILGFDRLGLDAEQTPFLGLQILTIICVFVVGLPFRGLLGGAYWFAAALALASILSEFSKTSFQRELRFVRFSLVEITRSGLFLVSVLGLIWLRGSRMPAWSALLCQAGAMILAFSWASLRAVRWKELFQVRKAWNLGREVISEHYRPLYGYFFILSVFSQIDIFMLRWLGNDQSVAAFGAASRYYNLLLLSLGAIHTVMLPMLQKVDTLEEWKDLLSRLNRLLFVFIPLVLMGIWLSGWIIPWIDHGKYPVAVPVFRILALSTVISFAFSPYVNLLMRFEDFNFLFYLIAIATVGTFALHAVMIPRFGPKGSAFATLISFGCINWATFVRARRHYQRFARASGPGPLK